MSTCCGFDLGRWLGSAWSAVAEELVDGEQFAAGAVSAGAEAAAGPAAVGAPLAGEVAGFAVAALVDGALAAGAAGWQDGWPRRAGCAPSPGGLPAGVGAVAAPAGAGERGVADGTADGGLIVTGIVTRRGLQAASARRLAAPCRAGS